jgi:hypothetical protein
MVRGLFCVALALLAALAAEAASSDSANFGRRANFTPKGTRVGEEAGTIRP